jgi:DNA processing protein
VIAIIGMRESTPDAEEFAFALASDVAKAGAVVVSGGAVGIDTAAHRGALEAGRTWVVAPNGRGVVFPRENAPLFDRVAASDGAMIWPFPDGTACLPACFLRRNGLLVALADVVVVVQAGVASGTLHAAKEARRIGRPVWAVPGPPWNEKFTGCLSLLEQHGARMMTSRSAFVHKVEGEIRQLSLFTTPTFADPVVSALFEACAAEPRHIDEIAFRARVCASAAATGLLTLSLENVLVEGPAGFYRRAN